MIRLDTIMDRLLPIPYMILGFFLLGNPPSAIIRNFVQSDVSLALPDQLSANHVPSRPRLDSMVTSSDPRRLLHDPLSTQNVDRDRNGQIASWYS